MSLDHPRLVVLPLELVEGFDNPEEARTLLIEAQDLGREMGTPSTTVLPACHLALLPGGDVGAALAALEEQEDHIRHNERMESRLLLWKATHDRTHLQEANRLLDHLVEHPPEEYRESMLKNVGLHREIMDAWEEYGEATTA